MHVSPRLILLMWLVGGIAISVETIGDWLRSRRNPLWRDELG